MYLFSNPQITIAAISDIPAITNLLNLAYRGETSRQGWTTEADLIAGNTRTDEKNVQEVMQQPGSVFLKYTNGQQQVTGCVNLQQHVDKIYLGMFSVMPDQQGSGIGKKILQAAEEYTRQLNCKAIYMSVISVRTELINWYKRHGYEDTGERKPFVEDDLTGKHLQKLEFMILEKPVLPVISMASENDHPVIIEIWELSVRATHHFLPEAYLQEIKALLPEILKQVPVYTYTGTDGLIKGFAGVVDQKIEMLFIHPDSRGMGLGRLLTRYCIDVLKAFMVDVNEQNDQAVQFYKKMGFVISGRQELDSLERPFPILNMQLST